jgi:hypothetical protein
MWRKLPKQQPGNESAGHNQHIKIRMKVRKRTCSSYIQQTCTGMDIIHVYECARKWAPNSESVHIQCNVEDTSLVIISRQHRLLHLMKCTVIWHTIAQYWYNYLLLVIVIFFPLISRVESSKTLMDPLNGPWVESYLNIYAWKREILTSDRTKAQQNDGSCHFT